MKKLPLLLIAFALLSCKEKPKAMSEAEKMKIFLSTQQEDLKPTRWDTGDTTMGNEDRLDLFYKEALDLKGGYVGVGSLQNFMLGAWAKSEYMWLVDFTRIVVATNRIHIEFIKRSKTPEEYVGLWQKKNRQKALAIIDETFKTDAQYKFIRKSYFNAFFYVNKRINLDLVLSKRYKYPIWLNTQPLYDHLYKLATSGKIQTIRGDLSGKISLQSIGNTARKMKLPMRLLYFSNAEEYVAVCWVPCNPQFRTNMLSMPVDAKSKVFRTVSSPNRRVYTWAPGSELTTSRGFHYNIQPGTLFNQWMKFEGKMGIPTMLKGATVDAKNGISKCVSAPPVAQATKVQ